MIPFLPADVGRDIESGAGLGTITGYTDANNVTVTIREEFPATSVQSSSWTILGSPMTSCTPSASGPTGASITLTLGAAGWRAEDVGKYVKINGGLCFITGYTSATGVSARVETELTSVVASPALAWTLEGSVWGGVNGYPRCGTFFGQRLWLAGSRGFPQTLWGSAIGAYFDFLLGVNDTDAISYVIASDEINPILHLAQTRGLVALTYGGEFSVRGGQEKPITPTNIDIKDQSVYGCTNVRPVRVGSEVYLVQKAGRKIRALAPDRFDAEAYSAPDISVLSEHVTKSGVVDMTYTPEPDSVVWICRADGEVATLTADRDQDVFAFARQVTQGKIQSIEAIPVADGWRLFASVRRVINGVSVTYIEVFEPGLHTDCAITGTSTLGATVWTGLNHLEGRRVNVKGDGVVLADRIVTGGAITIERPAFKIEIGLNYVTRVLTLTPEVPGSSGTAQGSAMSIHATVVRLRDTIGCRINYQTLPFVKLGLEVLDRSPTPFTGDKEAGNLGWDNGKAQTLIEQTLPYPFHLLAVISKITVNSG